MRSMMRGVLGDGMLMNPSNTEEESRRQLCSLKAAGLERCVRRRQPECFKDFLRFSIRKMPYCKQELLPMLLQG